MTRFPKQCISGALAFIFGGRIAVKRRYDLKHGLSLCLLLSLFSHSASAQTYRFSCPAFGGGYLPVSWNIMYSAYIPADHIQGPTSCNNYYYGGDKTKLYKGDGNADIGDGWPIQSARVYSTFGFRGSFVNSQQNAPSWQGPFYPSVGQSRNYGWLSPSNGSTLTSADEDGVSEDCLKWHQSGYGSTSSMSGDLTVSGATQQNGSARFFGTAANPLESSLARISWDMRVNVNGDNPTNARVTTINYNHSCFPAHVVKVQRFTTYYWGPPRSDTTYVFGCLVLQQGKIEGQSSPNKQVPCD